jgi:hypothetical protein
LSAIAIYDIAKACHKPAVGGIGFVESRGASNLPRQNLSSRGGA